MPQFLICARVFHPSEQKENGSVCIGMAMVAGAFAYARWVQASEFSIRAASGYSIMYH